MYLQHTVAGIPGDNIQQIKNLADYNLCPTPFISYCLGVCVGEGSEGNPRATCCQVSF